MSVEPATRDSNNDRDSVGHDDMLPADPHRMTRGMRLMLAVLMVVVAGMVGYLVAIVVYPERFASPSWIGAKSTKREGGGHVDKGFELGGVWLGMTPDQALAVYPSIRFTASAYGGRTGVFPHHDGEYRMSFHGPDKGERAYRISSRHVYPMVSYLELLSELTNKYGKPSASSCGAEEGTVAIQCALQWNRPDVALDAQIRTAAPAGGGDSRTTLTVTATDLRPESAFAPPAGPRR